VHDIWRARPAGDGWAEPELLPEQVNGGASRFNACVAPDESWIIVPLAGRDDSMGGVDYYISFRNADDTWLGPVNMGPRVNSAAGGEWSPAVSPDGRVLFLMSNRGGADPEQPLTLAELMRAHDEPGYGGVAVWWVDAGVIGDLERQTRAAAQGEAGHE